MSIYTTIHVLQNESYLPHLRSEKTGLTEEAHKIIKLIKQMEVSLDDDKSGYELDDRDLKVSYPLNRCLQGLKEKYNTVSKLHRERYEQVKSKQPLS